MLKTRVIPCLLLKDWNLVKTINFQKPRTIGNPVQYVKVFNARNVDELAIVDISATSEKRSLNYEIIADLSRECFMPLSVGGGISTVEQIRMALLSGADKTILNTAAFLNPTFISKAAAKFGNQCVVVSIDVKKDLTGEFVYIEGGSRNTGVHPVDWAKTVQKLGAGEVLLTSIDHDGVMKGFNLELIRQISTAVTIPVIACGGAGNESDFVKAVRAGADAVSAASIFLYTQITPMGVKQYMHDNGINTRC